jgi:hypothetical protein
MTIVGGGAEMRSMVSLSPGASIEELYDALAEPHLPSRSILCFLIPEKYLAEVGAEQVALEAQEDLSGRPAVHRPYRTVTAH